eukprot:877596-Pelagomonas_calceolata.AAC.4
MVVACDGKVVVAPMLEEKDVVVAPILEEGRECACGEAVMVASIKGGEGEACTLGCTTEFCVALGCACCFRGAVGASRLLRAKCTSRVSVGLS